METKRKKKISNIIMVALIAVVAFCGIMAVGGTRGWFGGSDSPVMSDDYTGVVNIERNGVAYALDEKVPIETGDIIETKNFSFVDFKINGGNKLCMNESAEIEFNSCKDENTAVTVNAGEIFADMPEAPQKMIVAFGENTANVTGTVFSVSVQSGSQSISVFEGQVEVTAADTETYTVKAGEILDITQNKNGNIDVESSAITAESLNGFVIEKLQDCNGKNKLCFTQDELDKVLADRETESEEARKSEGDFVAAESSKKVGPGTSGKNNNEEAMTCTIQIRCETILDNMENLASGKDRYVPSNGIILATSTVEFTEGETVFDALRRVCSYAGIQLEYSYTPLYESYYIEGINNLYEFDCGPQSGWMYKVNGWFPNYGCSGYELKDGDNIVWTYTCSGLGEDVGGNVR